MACNNKQGRTAPVLFSEMSIKYLTRGRKYDIIQLGDFGMRILPDKNFKASYKARYEANYEKITAKRQSRAEQKAASRLKPEEKKQRLVGAIVFSIVTVVAICTGVYVFNIFSEKERVVSTLEQQIGAIDADIKAYQTVVSDERVGQLENAVAQITALQTQYLSDTRSDNFEALATQYLGDYNESWSQAIDDKASLTWTGRLDLSDCKINSAKGVFILFQGNVPVSVVAATLETDVQGNFTKITALKRVDFE